MGGTKIWLFMPKAISGKWAAWALGLSCRSRKWSRSPRESTSDSLTVWNQRRWGKKMIWFSKVDLKKLLFITNLIFIFICTLCVLGLIRILKFLLKNSALIPHGVLITCQHHKISKLGQKEANFLKPPYSLRSHPQKTKKRPDLRTRPHNIPQHRPTQKSPLQILQTNQAHPIPIPSTIPKTSPLPSTPNSAGHCQRPPQDLTHKPRFKTAQKTPKTKTPSPNLPPNPQHCLPTLYTQPSVPFQKIYLAFRQPKYILQ